MSKRSSFFVFLLDFALLRVSLSFEEEEDDDEKANMLFICTLFGLGFLFGSESESSLSVSFFSGLVFLDRIGQ